jgi:hypothetical protein
VNHLHAGLLEFPDPGRTGARQTANLVPIPDEAGTNPKSQLTGGPNNQDIHWRET